MTSRRILALNTYPIRVPRHGGQRRCTALGLHYRNQGHQYTYAALVQRGHYPPDHVSPLDLETDIPDPLGGGWAADLAAARLSGEDDGVLKHFYDLAVALDADTFCLEHPFLWPLAERLLKEKRFSGAALIYSSHNVESQVKRSVFKTVNLSSETIDEIAEGIDELERDLVDAADLVIACTKADADIYRQWKPYKRVHVLGNGINPPPASMTKSAPKLSDRYLVFVGSAHLPNVTGFVDCVLGEGLQYLPPRTSIAVAGGVARLLADRQEWAHRAASNSKRAAFFDAPSDDELSGLIANAHGVLLPIREGGGSNLKTAEALVSGKWIVATPAAFRSFEHLIDEPGILIADTHAGFVTAIRHVLDRPPLKLGAAEIERRRTVTWDSILDGFVLNDHL